MNLFEMRLCPLVSVSAIEKSSSPSSPNDWYREVRL